MEITESDVLFSPHLEVYSFDDPIEFILSSFEQKKKKNARFSIRAWSKQMGFVNPSFLADVMRGKRKLKTELAMKIATSLRLCDEQRRYFEILVLYNNSNSKTERALYKQALENFKKSPSLAFPQEIMNKSITLRLSMADLSKAQEMIAQTCSQIQNFANDGTEIYQLSSQIFKMTVPIEG